MPSETQSSLLTFIQNFASRDHIDLSIILGLQLLRSDGVTTYFRHWLFKAIPSSSYFSFH